MANKKRLIDANALIEEVKKNNKKNFYDKDWSSEDVCILLKLAPTVSAVEVVHGRWIFKHNPITDPKKYFIRIVCSKCNLHTGQVSNYCPNCGAKMDAAAGGAGEKIKIEEDFT